MIYLFIFCMEYDFSNLTFHEGLWCHDVFGRCTQPEMLPKHSGTLVGLFKQHCEINTHSFCVLELDNDT